MNWLDNVIGFISPKRGAERIAWRQELEELRSYDAGNSGRLNSNWRVNNQSAEIEDRYNRDTIRARARDLEKNSDIANSILKAFRRGVVGKGITVQAKTKDEKLNTQIEELFKEWCKKKNCDVTGTQSFYQMIKMAVTRKKIDGGILFLKCYTSDGIVPFQLQAIEVDELDKTAISINKENKVVGGIEYNKYNRPIAYHLAQYDIDGYQKLTSRRVEAKDIIFYWEKRRPSQVREMSDFAPVISRVRDSNEFITAVSVRERVSACLGVLIKRINPQGGFGRNNSEKREGYQGKTLSPGMILEMNAGDEAQIIDPKGQATDATSFMKLIQRLTGAGQGLSYESVSRDMSQSNYSSARQGSIEDELTFEDEIEVLESVLSEIYETFVISAFLSGKIQIKDFWENKSSYLRHEWVKSPKRWIDPQKEANANKIALSTGQKTFKQIAAENGRDWKEQIDEMAEILEYAKSKGIELGGMIHGQTKDELYND